MSGPRDRPNQAELLALLGWDRWVEEVGEAREARHQIEEVLPDRLMLGKELVAGGRGYERVELADGAYQSADAMGEEPDGQPVRLVHRGIILRRGASIKRLVRVARASARALARAARASRGQRGA